MTRAVLSTNIILTLAKELK